MNLKKLSDNELLNVYQSGNECALTVLVDRHRQRVFDYINMMVKDRDLADDIFQETFMKAIVTIQQGRYTENGKFQAWLTRIAHNLVIDYFRQNKSENNVSSEDMEFDVFNNVSLSEADVETSIVQDQVLSDVRLLVKHLPAAQKEVVYMRYYQDLSFKEIADITGVSINTALGRMRYALLNLRRMATKHNVSLAIS